MKKIIFSTFILFSSFQLIGQTFSSIPVAKLETLHSHIVGMDYKLYISLPFGFNPKEKKYPVFYYLDAKGTSGGINEMVKEKMDRNEIDQIIMVGISYEANPVTSTEIRVRDYCPPRSKMDTLKRGNEFYDFIKCELIPYMESNYGADKNERGLLGYSLGGLFASWTLKQTPNLFNRLALISPSLWYGGDDFLLENDNFLKNIENIQGLRIFLCIGSLEDEQMVEDVERLYKLLSKNKNNYIYKVVFQDEVHSSVWYPATSRAISFLYKSDYSIHIKEGSRLYTFKVYDKALKHFELAFASNQGHVNEGDIYDFACLYALNDDSDNAFKYLNTLKESEWDWYPATEKNSDFKSLHNDERWNILLEALKKK